MAIVSARIVNPQAIEQALLKAFESWAEEDINGEYMATQFLDPGQWPYDAPIEGTERKSGEVVYSPRNIYDLGSLYRSGRDSFQVVNGQASWTWDAVNEQGGAYAWYVHEGLGTNTTPRPWTDDLTIPSKFESGYEKRQLIAKINAAFSVINAR